MSASLIFSLFNSPIKGFSWASFLVFAGAVQAVPQAVDSFTSSGDGSGGLWGTLESITVGSTTYTNLDSGTISGASATDLLAVDASFAANAAASIAGNNLDTAALNAPFTVQFGRTVTASDLFYFFETNSATSPGGSSDISIQAIDINGAAVGSSLEINDISLTYSPTIPGREWSRQSGADALTDRQTNSIVWSLKDMSLGQATNVTGFILSTEDADSVAAGIVWIPEPGAFALFAASLSALCVVMRRR